MVSSEILPFSGKKVGFYIDKAGLCLYKVRPCGKQLNHEILGKSFYLSQKLIVYAVDIFISRLSLSVSIYKQHYVSC